MRGTRVTRLASDPARPAVRAEAAVKIYRQGDAAVRALDGISVELAAGQFTSIMGPSGSGKSTLLHCLAALDSLTSGRVFLGATDLTGLGDRELTLLRRARIGFIFQSFNLLPALTVLDNITLPARIRGQKPDADWIGELVSKTGIAGRLAHRPAQLSGGEQQRVAAVRALAGRPDIVFADEPAGNLDSRASAELLAFLRAAVSGYGQTVVMVTHDPAAAAIADRVVFLADGRLAGGLDSPARSGVLDAIARLEG